MASNFPTSLDAFTNPTATDAMDSGTVPHATQHSDLNDAVEALQAKVGADSSAVTSSLDYKVAALEGQGAYTDYTPSFTNFTLGDGTVVARYTQVQDFVHYWGLITLGSTSSMGTAPQLTLPVTSANTTNNNFSSNVWYEDPGVQNATGVMTTIAAGAQAYFNVFVTSGTYGQATALTATVPFTWATGDRIQFNMVYEAA